MRKQTKIAAMVSAAALLTIGAVMTSSAATAGWQTDDGGETWFYTDKYGDKVTNEWKKSGNNWYYLGDDGYVVTSSLLRDTGSNNEIYYVNSAGVKVTNRWEQVSNEDGFVLPDGSEPSTVYYYFDGNGKALKADAGKEFVAKSVKKNNDTTEKAYFVFDEEGHMMTGWVSIPTTNASATDGVYVYYLGEDEEGGEAGVARTGWQYIEKTDETAEDPYEDSNWYWFSDTGKCAEKNSTRYIDGRYYHFNDSRRMDSGWFDVTIASSGIGTSPSAKVARTKSDGRMETGWVQRAEDESDDVYWYYLINERDQTTKKVVATVPFNRNRAGRADEIRWNGQVAAFEDKFEYAARSINNKVYLFNNYGQMVSGIVTAGQYSTDAAPNFDGAYVYNSNNSVMQDPSNVSAPYFLYPYNVYYFNNVDNNSMGQMAKNARVTVNVDGETFYYHFGKDGAAYTNAIVNGILYGLDGKRVQPDSGWMQYHVENAKYYKSSTAVYRVTGDIAVNSSGHVRMSNGSTVRIDGETFTTTWDITGATSVNPTGLSKEDFDDAFDALTAIEPTVTAK